MRSCPLHSFGHVFFQGIEHGVAAFPVDFLDDRDVAVNEAMLPDLVCDNLVESGGVLIATLLGQRQLADHSMWGDDPG